jgi:hypothetical protein
MSEERQVTREDLLSQIVEAQKTAMAIEWCLSTAYKTIEEKLPEGGGVEVVNGRFGDLARAVDEALELAQELHEQIARKFVAED